MQTLEEFLGTSYTGYQAADNLAALLEEHGFSELSERDAWQLTEGGAYYVRRGGNALIAFRYAKEGGAKLTASHGDSPCFKLKDSAEIKDAPYVRLNVEPYGGGLWYTFFDRPLKLAGRVVRKKDGQLVSEPYVSEFVCVIPSLAIHQQRGANDGFKPALQQDLPLLTLESGCMWLPADAVSDDIYAVPAEAPVRCGAKGELLTSPRIDDLVGVYASFRALAEGGKGLCIAACLASEEVGSRSYGGAWSDFLRSVLLRITAARGGTGEDYHRLLAKSLLLSVDNAQCLHPNHPETCDPTNRTVLGGGVVIKSHAGGAYTTDALTCAVVRSLLEKGGIPCQIFYNRSDMNSGTTLGGVSLVQVGVPSADIGIAQLAMHSAAETAAYADCETLEKALSAFYGSEIELADGTAKLG